MEDSKTKMHIVRNGREGAQEEQYDLHNRNVPQYSQDFAAKRYQHGAEHRGCLIHLTEDEKTFSVFVLKILRRNPTRFCGYRGMVHLDCMMRYVRVKNHMAGKRSSYTGTR